MCYHLNCYVQDTVEFSTALITAFSLHDDNNNDVSTCIIKCDEGDEIFFTEHRHINYIELRHYVNSANGE